MFCNLLAYIPSLSHISHHIPEWIECPYAIQNDEWPGSAFECIDQEQCWSKKIYDVVSHLILGPKVQLYQQKSKENAGHANDAKSNAKLRLKRK